jgi:hypothetical protein
VATCTIVGCPKEGGFGGFCPGHLDAWQRYPGDTWEALERFKKESAMKPEAPKQPESIPAGTRVKVVGIKGDGRFEEHVGKAGTAVGSLRWFGDGYIGRLDLEDGDWADFSGVCRWVVEPLPTEAPAKDEPCTLPEIPAGAKIRLHLKSGEAWDGTTSEPLRREADGSYSGRRVNYGMRGHMDMDHCTISLLSLPEAPKAAHACEHGGCGAERMKGGKHCLEHRDHRIRQDRLCTVEGCGAEVDAANYHSLCANHGSEYMRAPGGIQEYLAAKATPPPAPKPEAPKQPAGGTGAGGGHVNGAAKPATAGLAAALKQMARDMERDAALRRVQETAEFMAAALGAEPYASATIPPPAGSVDVTPEPEVRHMSKQPTCHVKGCKHAADNHYPLSRVWLCDKHEAEWVAFESPEEIELTDWLKTKERTMSKINSKKELSAAGLRLAGDLFVDNVNAMLKAAIIAGVGDGSPEMERRIEAFFASEVGKSIVDVAAAGGATLIPGVPESFSEELRIRAAHKGAYKLTNAVVGPLRDMAGDALKAAMPGKKRAKKPAAGALPAEPAQKRETIEISEAEIAEPATVGAKSGRVR